MKRRRGELSLFEILRDPDDKSKQAQATPVPKTPRGGSERSADVDESLLPSDRAESVGGSSTPPPAEERPRLDVTPISRSSRNRLAQELATSDEESATPAGDEPAGEEPRRSRLPELAPELTSTEITATPATGAPTGVRELAWWQSPVSVQPPILLIALIGIFFVGYLSYQAGAAATVEQYEGTRGPAAGFDPPEWQLHETPTGAKAEVQRVVDENGRPIGGASAIDAAGSLRREIVIAGCPGKFGDVDAIDSGDKIALYIDEFIAPNRSQLRPLGDDLIVYLGPFETSEEAERFEKLVRGIPKKYGNDFKTAYRKSLDFTPSELEEAMAEWAPGTP